MQFSHLDFKNKKKLSIPKKNLVKGLIANEFTYIRLKNCYQLAMTPDCYNLIGLKKTKDYTYVTLRPGDWLGIEGNLRLKKNQKSKYLELIPQSKDHSIFLYREGTSCLSYVVPIGTSIVVGGFLLLAYLHPGISISL